MVEPIHKEDSESIESRLSTATLAFKSIAGNTANYSNSIESRYSQISQQFANVEKIQERVSIAIHNITAAVDLMSQLYGSLFVYGNGTNSWSGDFTTTNASARNEYLLNNHLKTLEEFQQTFEGGDLNAVL